MRIPIGNGEALHVGPATGTTCDTHDWPTEGFALRLVAAMRERHGNGGVSSCRGCIERAKADADAARAATCGGCGETQCTCGCDTCGRGSCAGCERSDIE